MGRVVGGYVITQTRNTLDACPKVSKSGVRAFLQEANVRPSLCQSVHGFPRKVDIRLPGKREFGISWCEAGLPNHLDDQVDSDQ